MNKFRAIPKNDNRDPKGKSLPRQLWFALLSLIALLVSLFVCYPLSMQTEDFGELLLTIWALGFYLLQAASFVLCMLGFAAIFEKNTSKKFSRGWALLINLTVLAIFIYEGIWLLRHL